VFPAATAYDREMRRDVFRTDALECLCVDEDIAALAPHRPVRLRKLTRNGDVVHDPRDARGYISNRLRRLAL
jgi:hypothetical protein